MWLKQSAVFKLKTWTVRMCSASYSNHSSLGEKWHEVVITCKQNKPLKIIKHHRVMIPAVMKI